MKRMISLIGFAFMLAPAVGWPAHDYSFEYATIDLSGGCVSEVANPVEDILGTDLGGLSSVSSDYTITSVLYRHAPVNAASNWAIYE